MIAITRKRGRPGHWSLLLTSSVVVMSLLAAVPLHAAPADECYRIRVPSLSWARGGAWDDGALLVLDLLEQRFLRVAPGAQPGDRVSLIADGDWHHPASIKQQGDAIWVLDHGRVMQGAAGPRGEMLRMDDGLGVSRRVAIENRNLAGLSGYLGPQVQLSAVFDWAPLGEGFLGFTDLFVGEKDWMSAFLYFDDAGNQRIYRSYPTSDPVCNQYTQSSNYVAALGDVGYILFLDERPSIGRVRVNEDGVEILSGFPEDFRLRPRLDTVSKLANAGQGARQATLFYGILERSRLAAGLFAWGDHLYLLGKEAMDKAGHTAWWLVQLRPSDGSEVWRVPLPTTAAHLDVIPGEAFVALVEKGPVQGIGDRHAPYMETSSVVLIPTAWTETAQNRLAAGVQCTSLAR